MSRTIEAMWCALSLLSEINGTGATSSAKMHYQEFSKNLKDFSENAFTVTHTHTHSVVISMLICISIRVCLYICMRKKEVEGDRQIER